MVLSPVMKQTKKRIDHGITKGPSPFSSRAISLGLLFTLVVLIGMARGLWITHLNPGNSQTQTAPILAKLAEGPKEKLGMTFDEFDQMLKARGEVGIFAESTPVPPVRLSPTVTPQPTAYPSPLPTPTVNSNPQVNCRYDARCGGTKVTTKDECTSTVCCYTGSQWEIKSTTDCKKLTDELTQKQTDAWKAEQDRMNAEIKAMQEASITAAAQNAERQTQLLENCRAQAREAYKQPPMGSQSGTNGYVVGESPELRQKLNKALATCLELYGGRP